MKKELINTINKNIRLIKMCQKKGTNTHYLYLLEEIKKNKNNIKKFRELLMVLKTNFAGMGSFADISLFPKRGSGITRDEAYRLQRKLSNELAETMYKYLGLKYE